MYESIILIGHLGNEPEMRYIASGEAVTKFSLATNRSFKDAEGKMVKTTTWWRISAWGKKAEVCNNFLHKGSKVMVAGRMNADANSGGPRIWNTQQGQAMASYEITAMEVRFLDSRKDEDIPPDDAAEEIPF